MVHPFLRFAVDTNAVSELVRPRPNPNLMAKWEAHQGEIGIPSVVWHEMAFGLEKLPPSRKREGISAFLNGLRNSTLPILPYDSTAAERHARERARLQSIGRPIPFRDSQIGAIALARNLVLVTANVKDFEPMEGLEVRNWLIG